MIPNVRFTELLADIEPSFTTKSNASAAHTAVRTHLRLHSTFKDRWEGDFLAGSYARDTAIRPRRTENGIERADVDIVQVTNFATDDDPDDVLQYLSDVLEDEFTVERINKRSVRVAMSYAEIDVVPVVLSGVAYELPDRDLGRWKPTNPAGHNDWSRDVNFLFDGRFKPLVKLLKWWRRHNLISKRPKGFVLEMLVARHAPRGVLHYGEGFAQMLEDIAASYGALADLNLKPAIEDPSIPGSDILSKVSMTDWKGFIERVRVHAGYARRAQGLQDVEEATRLWRKLFGDRFKSTVEAARATSLGARVAASVPGSGFVFPNAPAAPNKPRGFA